MDNKDSDITRIVKQINDKCKAYDELCVELHKWRCQEIGMDANKTEVSCPFDNIVILSSRMTELKNKLNNV